MASAFAAILIEEIEEREIPLYIRDRSNPFEDYSERKFIKRFRVNKELGMFIINNIKEEIDNEGGIPVSIKVLTVLAFYARGSYQTDVGDVTRISQATVSRSIDSVTNAIIKIFADRVICFPSLGEIPEIKRRFFEKFGVPGVVGTIDCTHVPIIKPSENNPNFRNFNYMNRKGYYSLNVQLVSDHNLKIRSISAKYPGSVHDAFIWRHSALRTHMQNIVHQHNLRAWLLGDSGYPLEPWLLTPFVEPGPGTIQEYFNQHHASARNTVERCNGLLKSRFRCLSKHRVLHYLPTKAALIVNACAVLHNLCIDYNLEEPRYEKPLHPDDHLPKSNFCSLSDNTLLSEGRRIRFQVASGM